MTTHPNQVARAGQARAVYGISNGLLKWRDKTAEGRCRMCRRDDRVRPLTRHHVVPQTILRRRSRLFEVRNVAANQVPLCRPCHDLVENGDATARTHLRRSLGPDEVAFALQVMGRKWFDRVYPDRLADVVGGDAI